MAGSPLLLNQQKDGVLVAVYSDIYNALKMPRGLALEPELISGA
jgi:hypothetical protein